MREDISEAELQYRRDIAEAQIEAEVIEPIALDDEFDRRAAEDHRIAYHAIVAVLEQHRTDPLAATMLSRVSK